MAAARGEFGSRFGFLMAASGSAVGLGNIWGFPTNAASNGGAAFLFVYLILTFILAYPALMAELIIGRHTRANAVSALRQIATGPKSRLLGGIVGFTGIITVVLILSFYAVVSGWMLAWFSGSLASVVGLNDAATWLTADAYTRNSLFSALFMALTIWVISAGVHDGIEKWSSRLMPSLIVLLVLLSVYVLTLEGALDGLKAYLVPDFSAVADAGLLVSALGQAFFSLSLGVGTMLIYGSYLSRKENLAVTGSLVALLDAGIAFIAGLLILPAMYVAQANGVTIYTETGELAAGPGLIISVLPALFDSMGGVGAVVAVAFFALMSIASLTSSISMLEVPVAYTVETFALSRAKATVIIGALITGLCLVLVFNFALLFDFVVSLTTEFSQPLMGFFFVLFVGWIWHRNEVLQELQSGSPEIADTLFWKIWPSYIRFVCPISILAVYTQLLFF
ncbi:MAG: sodium-dependent transporter [Pseudohongiellaceae bacterium]|nr:sodium-dependent transporter [Pseudohongiellaceae bacterium]